jgi:hypothetical protein
MLNSRARPDRVPATSPRQAVMLHRGRAAALIQVKGAAIGKAVGW